MIGAGRTDAGVHAAGQVANFITNSDIPVPNLLRAIGGRLPKDITLVHMAEVPLLFHATRSAVRKLYRYTIYASGGRPVERLRQRYTYHFWQPLDVDRMREAAQAFVGVHDFAAMASRGEERETTVRTVYACEVYRHFDEVRIEVEGRGFLYNQVRNMAGTLIEIGRGRWDADCIPRILESKDRRNAGPTAPARGLSLQWVAYELNNLPDLGDWWGREVRLEPDTVESAGEPSVDTSCASSTSSPE
jgi:tRNA pseudouridine38-40 synthase